MNKNIKISNNIVYAIIGFGKFAKHLSFYFNLKKIKFIIWRRNYNNLHSLYEISKICKIFLIIINDNSIEKFFKTNYKILKNKVCIHFSGALSINNIIGFHPMMNFTNTLYHESFYENIIFIGEKKYKDFKYFFPKLKNKTFKIDSYKKPLYHALCVVANNFTSMIWRHFFNEMKTNFRIDKEYLCIFLKKTCENIIINHETCLTGPIIRNDKYTIKKNIESLDKNFKNIYKNFYKMYKEEKKI